MTHPRFQMLRPGLLPGMPSARGFAVQRRRACRADLAGCPPPPATIFLEGLSSEATDPAEVVRVIPGQASVGEGSVDRGNRRRPIFVDDAFGGGGLEPGGDIVPVPKGAADVACGRWRKATWAALPATEKRHRLAAASDAFGDVGHGDELVFDGDRLEPESEEHVDGTDGSIDEGRRVSVEADVVPTGPALDADLLVEGFVESLSALVIDWVTDPYPEGVAGGLHLADRARSPRPAPTR